MPNFSYTASKAWTPYTFEEIIKPYAMYTEEYNKLEEALSALDAEAATAGAMASETNDPVTYARYKSYLEAIQKQADDIAKNGLNPSSRRAVLDLRTRYKSDIAPIGEAIKRRRELADEIRKAKLANPTLMVQRDFNMLSPESSLDRFIENPEYNYGDTYSGALLTKQVSDMASHLAKELRGTGKGKLDDYTNTFLKKYGLSSDEVLLAITNPTDKRASKALLAIYNSALESVPLSLREQYAEDINSYINQGFWSAVGLNLISPYENYGARQNAIAQREALRRGNDGTKKKSRVPDITSYFFKKDRETIPNILTEDNKLRGYYHLFFKTGKFTKPTQKDIEDLYNEARKSTFSINVSIGDIKKGQEELYNQLNNILSNAGYSLEQINNMSKEQVLKVLLNIYELNKPDVVGRDVYRFSLNDASTKYIFSKLQNRGLSLREIRGIKEGALSIGDKEDVSYEKGSTGDILYDPKDNKFSLLYNGKYYKMPEGMISNNYYTLMNLYSSKDELLKISDANKIIESLTEKYNTYGSLTEREQVLFLKALDKLDFWESTFSEIGDHFTEYIGTTKVNS